LFVPSGLVAQVCDGAAQDSVAVLEVARGIIAADNAGDLNRVLAHYAPDAVLHPPGERPVTGLGAIRPRYEGLFASYAPDIASEIESVGVCGELAVVSGRNTGWLRGLHGAADRRLGDAFVMVLGLREGEWRITRLIWHPDGT
jgi:uncharacterized protein (TIGR02246 family)